jgi:hypothetical protein
LIGNKRSGTSQLVRLLNLHPHIFVAHEADTLWILYQFHNQMAPAPHPWDSAKGMNVTLAKAGACLNRERTPRENYFALQARMMEAGNPWMPASCKDGLAWSGDKKPFQHGDPRLVDFAVTHLPDAAFVHIVRHPFVVALSSHRFNRTAHGDFWLELSMAEKVERWTFHENLVDQVKRRFPDQLHTLRYEDLCADPVSQIDRLLAFLQVEGSNELAQQAPSARPPGTWRHAMATISACRRPRVSRCFGTRFAGAGVTRGRASATFPS